MPLKGMTNTRRTPSHSHSLIGMALVAGLLLTACSHSSHDDENASEPTTTPSTSEVVLGGLDEKTGAPATTIALPAPTPDPAPAPDPAPPADPTTTTSPAIHLIPPGGLVIQPAVTSIHGRKYFTCADATNDDFGTDVSWTTAFAAKVNVTVAGWGVVTYYDQPVNGSHIVGIPCGTTVTVTVTAIGANGVVGSAMTLKIVIDPAI